MRTTSPKRGSALLIVLGLLGFLMISAVAFAISMRTERAAAAAYRRSLQARELLATVFADARATVNYALNEQASEAGFSVNDDNTHTVEALAPFKYSGSDQYGRILASTTSQNDSTIAHLLDDAVMRHLPPYVAYAVYETLEMDECPNGNGETVTGNAGYNLDQAANWKAVTAQIPQADVSDNQLNVTVDQTTIGRMAWAVVNLSDALDINAIGSVSQRRGIGLTGSEFAFGQLPGDSSSSGRAEDRYDLLPSTADAAAIELPIFASGADLSLYAARVDGGQSLIQREANSIFPYSWECALDEGGDAAFSPFTVYSFWPNARRRTEAGARRTSNSGTGAATSTVIACNEVDEAALIPSCEVEDLAKEVLGTSGTEGTSFARLLLDYIDTNSKPEMYETSCVQDLFNNALPTVENVPMVSEVAYSNDGFDANGDFLTELEDAVKQLFGNNLKPDDMEQGYDTLSAIPTTLKVQDLNLPFPDATLNLALRAYFPGRAESTESFDVAPEGFVAVYPSALQGSTVITSCFSGNTSNIENATLGGGALSLAGGGEDLVFESASNITFTGANMTLKMDGTDIPIIVPAQGQGGGQGQQPIEVSLNFLVDFVFRVAVTQGADVVDLAPADRGRTSKRTKDDYPNALSGRLNEGEMAANDAQFFRVTRPVSVTFALQWNVQETQVSTEGGGEKTVYTVTAEFASGHEPEATCDPGNELAFDGGTLGAWNASGASCLSSSPESGAWYTIDPRYNWLSPMLGVTGNAGGYGLSGYTAKISSPHWLFLERGQVTTGNEQPSDLQNDYADANQELIPFAWGLKINEIRYGYNDAGQLLLPGEIGFLPVPFSESVWTPNEKTYLANSLENYYDTVAKPSFFRTLPITDFNDGAFSGVSPYSGYDRAVDLTTMFESFGGDNFPEEHRGIVNVFSGMDDYYTCQRLRQFAMMGVPSSIRQAAKVTYDRLTAASDAKRVPGALVTEDLKSLDNDAIKNTTLDEEPKYDAFVRDYLFPIPEDAPSADSSTWNQSYELYPGVEGTPVRPKRLRDAIIQSEAGGNNTFAAKLMAYNTNASSSDKLGQNDMTTLVSIGNETFGDRQQLFLYILRADAIAYNSGRDLSQHKPLSTARAVALVWRDAYGELPDRIIYWQYLP